MSPSSTRRQLLRATTGLAISITIAGCNQAATSDATTSKITSEPTTDPRTFVDITQESHIAKAWTLPQDRFRFPKGDSVSLANLDEAVRDAVRTAIDSPPYSTYDASQGFLDSLDDINLVTYEDTVWNVKHTFPTVTVRLDTEISEDEPDEERTATHDGDAIRSNGAIEDLVSTIAPLGVETAPRPYETTRLDPEVQDFLDRYDYIETPRGVGELVVSRTNRSPPHTVRAEEATDEELYGRRIREAADYGPPTRAFIDRLLASDRKTPGNYQDRIHVRYPDDVPRQFARDLDHGSNYVRVDDEVYGFDTRHVHWDDLPVTFDATILGENEGTTGPIDIQLSVQNSGDDIVRFQMEGCTPFGVLWAYGPGGDRVLWNDAYEQAENVSIENGSVLPESHTEMNLQPGKTLSVTYRLGHDNLGDKEPLQLGTYEILGTIWAKWPTYEGVKEYDWRSQLFPYTLSVEVV